MEDRDERREERREANRRRRTYGRSLGRLAEAGVLALLAYGMTQWAKAHPEAVTAYYAPVSAKVAAFLARVFSYFPFSAAEVGAIVIAVLVVFGVVGTFFDLLHWKRAKQNALRKAANLVHLAASLAFMGVLLWGLNYYATPLGTRMALDAYPVNGDTLFEAAEYYVAQANALADDVPRNDDGGLSAWNFDELSEELPDAYDSLFAQWSLLKNDVYPVKAVWNSRLMSLCGYTGIYIPYTAESNVNTETYTAELPFTMAHEAAHRLSVAPEDEANFVGFLACSASDDVRFRYSGYYIASLYMNNALYGSDMAAYRDLRAQMSDALLADLNGSGAYYAQFEGDLNDKATELNDDYLKSMGQEEGVASYDEVVTLLTQYYLSGMGGASAMNTP